MSFVEKSRVAMEAMSRIVDMSDQRLRDFIKFVLQNKGKLPTDRAKKEFNDLSPEAIEQLEGILDRIYGDEQPSGPDAGSRSKIR